MTILLTLQLQIIQRLDVEIHAGRGRIDDAGDIDFFTDEWLNGVAQLILILGAKFVEPEGEGDSRITVLEGHINRAAVAGGGHGAFQVALNGGNFGGTPH